jgi:predicted RNA-binding Zn-ribbon protein involved in translation (DUF1610 family)
MTMERIIHGLYRGDSKAIKEAIKTLEQEPDEDTISRADAVRVASGYCHPANIAKELAKLPPAQPKPNVGHWINKSEQDAVTLKIYECSECGKFAYRDFDYCPNCGSDNRVRDKE